MLEVVELLAGSSGRTHQGGDNGAQICRRWGGGLSGFRGRGSQATLQCVATHKNGKEVSIREWMRESEWGDREEKWAQRDGECWTEQSLPVRTWANFTPSKMGPSEFKAKDGYDLTCDLTTLSMSVSGLKSWSHSSAFSPSSSEFWDSAPWGPFPKLQSFNQFQGGTVPSFGISLLDA